MSTQNEENGECEEGSKRGSVNLEKASCEISSCLALSKKMAYAV